MSDNGFKKNGVEFVGSFCVKHDRPSMGISAGDVGYVLKNPLTSKQLLMFSDQPGFVGTFTVANDLAPDISMDCVVFRVRK